ncbi:hypothetical protein METBISCDRAFT_12051 [Metschnikowia bicuspidata]|uniref:SAC3/GANP/THP3 conserved domain-containing protein n=1 Tax=Metschnikowia bicuspidata TaxID=27322 RepID=A0A4P9ZJF7_9ASCO|nr:hypothetical protein METBISCDRAFT_12051 [Metschnikowia bicuspidata]
MKTYNEVTPTDLGQKRRKTTPPASAPDQLQTQWPPSLLQFVNRSFARAESLSEHDKAQFHQQIQHLIYIAAKEHKVWSNDWTAQRLPIFDSSVPLALVQDTSNAGHTSAGAGHKRFDSAERKSQRSVRFAKQEVRAAPKVQLDPHVPIVGTLKALEKRYLRLTSAPDTSTVRPQCVLEKCLDYVVHKYRTCGKHYIYINDQLKAIRQDLTVQHIKNDFAMRVYETHGRIAMENGDLGEFNQCLSQLRYLYSLHRDPAFYKHTYEFQCYRVLYFLITGNKAGVNTIHLELLDRDAATDPLLLPEKYRVHRECLYKAIELLRYSIEGNYHQNFSAYKWYKRQKSVPCAFLLFDRFMATKERLLAMNTMSKAYKTVPVSLIESELGFCDAEFETFCRDFGLAAFLHDHSFDCGSARATLQAAVYKGQFKKVDTKGQI